MHLSEADFSLSILFANPEGEKETLMTDKPQRSDADRRAEEERRLANIPISVEDEKRTSNERRSGEERRQTSE